jgi:hypothetical protein
MWQTRAELLAVQLQQAQERILALDAPKNADASADALERDSAGVDAKTTQEPAESKQRPWWRFW